MVNAGPSVVPRLAAVALAVALASAVVAPRVVAPVGRSQAPPGRSEAPAGQITFAVHVSPYEDLTLKGR
jgi:hypothetical protein